MKWERIISLLLLFLLTLSVIVAFLKTPPPSEKPPSPGVIKPLERGELAIIYIYGPIEIKEPVFFALLPRGSDYVVWRLRQLQKVRGLKAVLLRINSPGGSVAAVQDIYEELKKLKEKGVKIVSSLGEIATSGAYYIASISDAIVAEPGTITGSIGVIIPMVNMKELLNKLGIKMYSIKSGKFKDIGTIARELTEEEREILEQLVNEAYNQFLEAVKSGRGEKFKGVWEEVADGRIFSGERAKKLGLVDYLGNFEDAKRIACELAGIKGEPRIVGGERRGWESLILRLEEKIFAPLSFFHRHREPILEYRYYSPHLFEEE